MEEAVQAIARNPTSYARVIDQARRALLKTSPEALWYLQEEDGSIVIACLHHRRNPAVATSRAQRKSKDEA